MPTTRITKQSINRLEELVRGVQDEPAVGVRKPLSIPGYDSFVPSYSSGGADTSVRGDGELERDTQRDQRFT